MTTKTKSEAWAVYDDINANLLPLVKKFASMHQIRADYGDKHSAKELDRIQKRLVKLIQDTQPGPLMEADDV